MILRSRKKIVEMEGKNSNEGIINVASQSVESVVGEIERI